MLRVLIWILMLAGGIASGLEMDFLFFPHFLSNFWFHLISFIFGILSFKLMINSSKNTGRLLAHLGREGNLPRMQTNKLVTEGYYACMRHPMHLGLFLLPLSIALIIGSISFIFFITPLEILFMFVMIKLVEEPEAIKKFGDDYSNYIKQVPMFSFRMECLIKLFSYTKIVL